MATEMNHAPTPRRRKKRRPRWQSVLFGIGKVLGTMLLVGMVTGLIMACFAVVYIQTAIMPQVGLDLGDITLKLTSTMYYTDENGQRAEYLTLSGDQNRVWVNYDEIPENLIDATVATEDKRFYQHHGVDWLRTGRSVISMFTGGSIQGGSTITQQLIKNLTQYDDVTVKRKITEIFSALEFDKNYTKESTLEWYLNYIYLGERCYGVSTAAYTYFGKPVSDLSLVECASLIGITNNPSLYDPYLNVENNAKRTKLVLKNMWEQEKITEEEYNTALAQVPNLQFKRGVDEAQPAVVYTWYQDKVIKDVRDDLMAAYGWSEKLAINKIYNGGLSIETCLDKSTQDIVDEVYGNLDNLPMISSSGQQIQSGIVVIDSVTGNVSALAGGMGEKKKSRAWSRASDAIRPPGSAIKPLAVYAPAMEMGLITPYSVLDDVPYQLEQDKAWPVNAYGYYNGRMTVSDALKVSSNTMAVRVLGDYVTPQASFDFMQDKFGFTSLVKERWVGNQKFSDVNLAPLALGGLTDGASPYEMAAAYSTFPRMGKYVEPRTYTTVTDSEGKVLLDNTQDSRFILKESTAYYMNSMLKNVVTSGTGTAARFDGMTMAGKTGTTSNKKDRWFVGYTPYYTAAVWVGYDQQERMDYSGNPPAAMWKKVMETLHKGLENKDFPQPADGEIVEAAYCLDSGMKPTAACNADMRGSRVATGYYVKGDEPAQSCTAHEGVIVCNGADTTAAPEAPAAPQAGGYYPVGEFCPEATRTTVGVLTSQRNWLGGTYSANDGAYFKSVLDAKGVCPVHTHKIPVVFNPEDQATWPTDDPNFNIDDLTTWPGYVPPSEEPTPSPSPSQDPGTGLQPGIPEPDQSPPPTLPTEPTPVPTPDDTVPFVPAA